MEDPTGTARHGASDVSADHDWLLTRSTTAPIAVIALFGVGDSLIRNFSVARIIGIVASTCSSINVSRSFTLPLGRNVYDLAHSAVDATTGER
ncbi:MAG: hypothetical protein KDK91_25785, partial [Gammaproteobacteria bacterium]|nr:hypothetical protein [Gammaproteobacteria bacterium]